MRAQHIHWSQVLNSVLNTLSLTHPAILIPTHSLQFDLSPLRSLHLIIFIFNSIYKLTLAVKPPFTSCLCYNLSPTHVEHTFSFLLCDNLTLAATCADGSSFISVLLLTWLLPWSFQEHEVTCYLSFIFHFHFTLIRHASTLLFSYMHYPYILHMFTLLHTWGLWYIRYSRYSDVL